MTETVKSTSPDLLPIGEFASASRLSHKALRLYDELNLLPPSRVDEQSGYRYYAATQLEQARLISLLRQLDLPLAQISGVLSAPKEQQAETVRVLWAAIKANFIQRDELARYIVQKLQGASEMTQHYDVQEHFIPAQQFACITRRVYVKDLPATIQQKFPPTKWEVC